MGHCPHKSHPRGCRTAPGTAAATWGCSRCGTCRACPASSWTATSATPARPPGPAPGRAARHAAAGLPPRHCRGSPRQPPSRPGLDCTLKGAYGDHIGERGSQDDEVAKKNSFCGIPTSTSPHLFGVQLCLGSSVRRRLSGPACHSLLPGRCCSPCLPPALHPLPPFPLLARPSRLKTAGGTPGQGDAAECARPNRWRPSLNPLAGTEEASRIPRRCA